MRTDKGIKQSWVHPLGTQPKSGVELNKSRRRQENMGLSLGGIWFAKTKQSVLEIMVKLAVVKLF